MQFQITNRRLYQWYKWVNRLPALLLLTPFMGSGETGILVAMTIVMVISGTKLFVLEFPNRVELEPVDFLEKRFFFYLRYGNKVYLFKKILVNTYITSNFNIEHFPAEDCENVREKAKKENLL